METPETTQEDPTHLYRTLLESTKAIPWKIDWRQQRFTYIGPQIEQLLGWKVNEWNTVQDWASRVHPDEYATVVERCVQLSQAGIDHEMDYRALTADDRYIWVRETVHVLRNEQGETEALVGFMFDISERKATEEKLLHLQDELQALSYKDPLTNIANRRRFDEALEQAWHTGMQQHTPVSLIMLDIDLFKQFNDHYGHIGGDACLIIVAQTLQQACDKISDLVARFGGEEFAVLLPGVDAQIARKVAERFRQLLEQQAIPHALSPFGHRVTASIGVGSTIPQPGVAPITLVDAIDRLLYQAKRDGRHRIISAHISLRPEMAHTP